MNAPYYFVFDVESLGLHGDGFAVAYVVVDPAGQEQETRILVCPPINVRGYESDRAWIAEHVWPHLQNLSPEVYHSTAQEVRETFWTAWRAWADRSAVMAADVAWPVEARFLNACIDADPAGRNWEGPYPLIDIASVRLGAGLDPMATCPRLPSEQPAHHPLADARQSARLLIEALS